MTATRALDKAPSRVASLLMRSVSSLTLAWPVRPRGHFTAIGAATLASLVLVAALLGTGSPVIPIALTALLTVWLCMFISKQPARALLFLAFVFAPMDISKSIVSPDSRLLYPDAPGLAITPADVAILCWASAWAWKQWRAGSQTFRWTALDLAILAFLGWLWLRTITGLTGGLGVATAIAYSKYVFIFLVLAHGLRSTSDWRLVLRASLLVFGFQAAYVAVQVLSKSSLPLPGVKVPTMDSVVAVGEGDAVFRPIGFFIHPNTLADYLVLLLPTPLCVMLLGPKRLPRRVWQACAVVLLVGLGMLAVTLSRGGWVACTLAFSSCVFAFWRTGLLSTRRIMVGIVLVAMGMCLTVIAYPKLLLRITAPDSRSLESRALLNQQALMMIAAHPLVGVGFASYNRASRDVTPPGFAGVSADYQKSIRMLVVHNHYLLLAGELGLPAMLLFLGIFGTLIKACMPLQRYDDPGRLALVVGLSGALIGNMIFLASDNYYADIRIGMLWMVAGLLRALQLGQAESSGMRAEAKVSNIIGWQHTRLVDPTLRASRKSLP